MAVRAAERDLEVIGEAVRKMKELDDNLTISGYRDIIGLRNIIVHSYDSLDPAILWKIILQDIPILKSEISSLKNA